MRSGSPLTTVGCRSTRNTTPSPARRSARSTSARTIWSMRTSSTTSLGFAPRASSTTSPTSAVSSSSSAMMSARRLARSASGSRSASCEHLDVGAQARDRRAQLVAGVGDEVALRLGRLLERVERRVEAARQARELVLALDLQPLREVGIRRSAPRSAGEARHRRQRRRATTPPSTAATRMPTAADGEQDSSSWRSDAVDLGQRARDLGGAAIAAGRR